MFPAVLVAVVFVAGCADEGSDGAGSAGEVDDLIDRMPEPDPPAALLALDLDAAGDSFGLPADADPAAVDVAATEPADPQGRLFHVAAIALPYLDRPQPPPIQDAVDHSRVTAAVTNGKLGGDGFSLIATDQPFDEIAAALEADGYERDGDVLSRDGETTTGRPSFHHVAGGDGVVALSTDAEGGAALVRAALAGEVTRSDLLRADLAAALDAPLMTIVALEGDCVRAIAVADTFDQAELTVVTRQPATASGFAGPRTAADHRFPFGFEEPTVDGDRLQVTVQPDDGAQEQGQVFTWALTGDVPADALYTCVEPEAPELEAPSP